MGQALYRTYRSKTLAEIVGQEHITQALSNALQKGLISHAYLFTGPRGVGKTSIARILAHEINGIPYEDDRMHLDIIEIDAASNRRIDEIRDLRDKVHIAPSQAKYKVYIIDEVHMLTKEAFNALLKTLEEPPAHAIFILATTELHKLPETIVSRTQRFTFKSVALPKVVDHLREIATKENIVINDEALALVAAHGEGSFRDSISLLDQARGIGHDITSDDIRNILGIAPATLIAQLLQALSAHSASEVVRILQQLQSQGSESAQIARQLSEAIRGGLLADELILPHEQTFTLLLKLIDVPAAAEPRIYLEIILLDATLSGSNTPVIAAPQPKEIPAIKKPTSTPQAKVVPLAASKITAVQPVVVAPVVHPNKKVDEKVVAPVIQKTEPHKSFRPKIVETPPEEETPEADGEGVIIDAAVWPGVIHKIKQNYNTLYGILRTAEPIFTPGVVTLQFGFAFHQKRSNQPNNKQIIAETIKELVGHTVQIVCVVNEALKAVAANPDEEVHSMGVASDGDSPSARPKDAESAPADTADYYVAKAEAESARPIEAVSNIFGGGELLES